MPAARLPRVPASRPSKVSSANASTSCFSSFAVIDSKADMRALVSAALVLSPTATRASTAAVAMRILWIRFISLLTFELFGKDRDGREEFGRYSPGTGVAWAWRSTYSHQDIDI